jgi:hypothetical protein
MEDKQKVHTLPVFILFKLQPYAADEQPLFVLPLNRCVQSVKLSLAMLNLRNYFPLKVFEKKVNL